MNTDPFAPSTLDYCVKGFILLLFIWGGGALIAGIWEAFRELGSLKFTETMPGNEGSAYRRARHQWLTKANGDKVLNLDCERYERE